MAPEIVPHAKSTTVTPTTPVSLPPQQLNPPCAPIRQGQTQPETDEDDDDFDLQPRRLEIEF